MKLTRTKFIIIGIIAAVAGALVMKRDPIRRLTPDQVKAARQLWSEKGPKNYRMNVVVSGVQQGNHLIEVRNGEVKMTTGGEPVPEHVLHYWTVEGMLGFMEEECAQWKASPGGEPKAFIHGDFDPELGYPQRFLRQIFGKNKTVEWEVKSFEPL